MRFQNCHKILILSFYHNIFIVFYNNYIKKIPKKIMILKIILSTIFNESSINFFYIDSSQKSSSKSL